ncbi:MAG: Hpt domain-containing protein [Alphaproteobacteria bacterium]|nr:Hpt domain-containing protein [Alphaproteobacteria bacterium]HPF45585.1 Hpt domain-containing protein [Emcibacteraceae bacterium]
MNEHLNKEQMLARANNAVEKAGLEFSGELKKRIRELEIAIHQNNRQEAVLMAYNLESEASTFGWPRVTRICKWLRKIFSGEFDLAPEAEEVLDALNALKVMVSNPEERNEQRDAALFEKIYPSLKRVISEI